MIRIGRDSDRFIKENIILRTQRGSRVYGTNITPELADKHDLDVSDKDYMSIIIPPLNYHIGMPKALGNFESTNIGEEEVHSLKKYMKLAAKCNPNVLECLFVEPKHIDILTPMGQTLIENRKIFLSKRAFNAYGGYGRAQREKMLTKRANKTGRQYLVKKYGYDTKFAMHMIRLLRQGREILGGFGLHPERHDAEELLAIRLGEYSLEEVLDLYDKEDKLLKKALQHSKLPKKADMNAIEKLCMELHHEFFRPLAWMT